MSIAYRILHTTRFDYPIPVSVCHNVICLTPRPDPRLTINAASITILPRPTIVNERMDWFGNVIHAFSIEEPHDSLTVQSVADLVVHEPIDRGLPGASWEQVAQRVAEQTDQGWLEATPYLYDSPLVSRSHEALSLASEVFTPGRPIREAAIALTELIHDRFEYKPGATHVDTDSEAALRDRRGVCQDFAHAMLASLRTLGLPARYVSGYLRTIPPAGQPRLVGVDQSHAWASVYAGAELGWLDLDPTNAMACGVDHIPVAAGRDYTDIAPIRGAFLGGGDSRLTVTVDVAEKMAV